MKEVLITASHAGPYGGLLLISLPQVKSAKGTHAFPAESKLSILWAP
jgi:hypothetical protein